MKNKLFFSSLIIMGMIFTSMNGALALSQDIGFTVPGQLSIERNSSSVLAATATISGEQTLTLDNPITFTYDVTNADSEERSVALNISSVYYENGDASKPAKFYSDLQSTDSYIVFTKQDAYQIGIALNAVAANPNLIRFPIECTEKDDNVSYYGIKYTLAAGTTKSITCTISGTADQFAMNDEPGTYKATVSITNLLE